MSHYSFEFKYFENVSAKELKSSKVKIDSNDIHEAEDLFMKYHPDAVIIMVCTEGEI